MQRYSFRRQDHWDLSLYLVFNAHGEVRMTRGRPSMSPGERCMALDLKVPHSLFKVPELRGTITLNEATTEPPAVDIAVAEAALSEALGTRVELTVKQGDEN